MFHSGFSQTISHFSEGVGMKKIITVLALFSVLLAVVLLSGCELESSIDASAGTGGAISPSGEVVVPLCEDQTFTITADAGYDVGDVFVDGVSVGAVDSYTFADVSEDHSISAIFAPEQPGDGDDASGW